MQVDVARSSLDELAKHFGLDDGNSADQLLTLVQQVSLLGRDMNETWAVVWEAARRSESADGWVDLLAVSYGVPVDRC